ncbi:glutamate decarboxylase [Nocardiopsis sp. MG754419]|uniref:glutamate decarboxylase n=1 Tax=Nocardiopsis sp. MG754419 TaxID=2259865 RepID=UPI001BA8ECB0|nr:glutamate decarboxylase [Nocardiopsis sp. MG754419]MBR8744335.1 glutamate decarboxylase [Nocardiopsis sp. MG754419]
MGGRDDGDVYTERLMRHGAPKADFPERGTEARVAYQLVHDELMLDGVSRMNLATFCTTWTEPEVHRLMDESIGKNMIDKDEYPQTAELERRCVRMLADLWHAPDPGGTMGTSTTGSSEAAMLGGLAAKFAWRRRREAEGGATDRPNLVCGPVQVCWEKFARYFDVELRRVPLRGGAYVMTPDDIDRYCDENTIMVVCNFGQTFTGLFEDVSGVAAALDRFEERTGHDIRLHVDAADGGFLAPFVSPDLVWDFRLPRVRSINASGHKSGLAPLGSGWAIWREERDLPEDLIFWVDYLGGDEATFNLNFSRPGGPVVAQYYDFVRLGREGYRRIHSAKYGTARHLADRIAAMGPFEIIHGGHPERGVCAVAWRMVGDEPFTLYDLADRLRTRGWLVPAYPLPADRQDEVIQRVLVRHGFSHDMSDLFLEDLRRSIEHLRRHPPSPPLDRGEGGGFNHGARSDPPATVPTPRAAGGEPR